MKNTLIVSIFSAIFLWSGLNLKAQTQILEYVEQMPEFDGSVQEYLAMHMEYPTFANDNNIEGKVIVRFVIGEDGSVQDAKIVRSVHSTLDSAAARCIRGMPKWTPGRQEGRAVRVWFTQPINFHTENTSTSGNIELDSFGGSFNGPRSVAFSKFPEYDGDVDKAFSSPRPIRTDTTQPLPRGKRFKILATIDEKGFIQNVRVLKGYTNQSPELLPQVKEHVVNASYKTTKISKWKPAIKDGKNVACDVILTVILYQ